MKSIILHQHEVTQLSATGEVTVIRVVDKKCQRFENAIPLPEAVETERGLMDFPGMKPGDILFHNGLPIRDGEWQPVSCPFATIKEVRWVRETWGIAYISFEFGNKRQNSINIGYKADGVSLPLVKENTNRIGLTLISGINYHSPDKWRSSTTMPEWASRFKIECTGTEIKRLQDVTENEAIKSGFKGVPCKHEGYFEHGCTDCMNSGWLEPPTLDMMYFWDKHNPHTPWSSNPWVFVTTHKKVG